MPPLKAVAGNLLVVERPAGANTIEHAACPRRMVTVADARIRDLVEGD